MIADRLKRLQALMAERQIEAYLVPGTDEHQNEFVPDCWQRRRWLSGFTGSAGNVAVTRELAGLWTDGRYHVQASEELDLELFTLFRLGLPEVKELDDWLRDELKPGEVVGVDPRLLSIEEARRLKEKLGEKGKSLKFVEENLVDLIWEDRPPLPANPIRALPEAFSGESVTSKLSRCREQMAQFEVDAHVVSRLDAIAWLFNLRGTDIPYNPVFIAYALITEETATLFVDPHAVTEEVEAALIDQVTLRPYGEIEEPLADCAARGWKVWIDPKGTSQWIYQQLSRGRAPLERESPLMAFKAAKNPVERQGMRECHIRDGAAVVRFLRWLEARVAGGGVTELSAARRLEAFRAELDHFQGLSFETIVGYLEHGAIIHYAPSEGTDRILRPDGLLLVDSGGHYLDGTTDVTRTVTLGAASPEQRAHFTRVLKGHIRLARTRFPRGTTGRQLDALARLALWEIGLDYRHGTGHGVGAYLNVHEGPQSLSPRDPGIKLEPGMVLSNEPGYYEEGAYGIRIESVMLVEEEGDLDTGYGPFYRFEILTMVPIDLKLIDGTLLSPQEKEWLNAYHAEVCRKLSPLLDEADRHWLEAATKPI